MSTPDSPEATNAQLALLDKLAAAAIADLTASNLGTTITNPASDASPADTGERGAFGPIPVRIDTPDPDRTDGSDRVETINPPGRSRSRGRLWALAAAIVLLIAGAVVAYAVTRTDKQQRITTDPTKPSTPPFVLPDGPVEGIHGQYRGPVAQVDLHGYFYLNNLLLIVDRVPASAGRKPISGDQKLANGASANVEQMGPRATEIVWTDPEGRTIAIDAFGLPEVAKTAAGKLPIDADPNKIAALNEFGPLDDGTARTTLMWALLGGRMTPRDIDVQTVSLDIADTSGSGSSDPITSAAYAIIPTTDPAGSLKLGYAWTGGSTDGSTTVNTNAGEREGWLWLTSEKGGSVSGGSGMPQTSEAMYRSVALLGFPLSDDLAVIVFASRQQAKGESADVADQQVEALARTIAKSLHPVTEAEFLAGTNT